MPKSNRKVYNYFNPPPSPSLTCEDASLTRQEFQREADINDIMRKYASGLPPSPAGSRPPQFGDFSELPDYQSALDTVIRARDAFDALPSALRRRFNNDPSELIEFLSHDENRSEARSLGLLKPEPVSVPPDVPDGAESSARQSTTC